jgi:hypothetical protein
MKTEKIGIEVVSGCAVVKVSCKIRDRAGGTVIQNFVSEEDMDTLECMLLERSGHGRDRSNVFLITSQSHRV